MLANSLWTKRIRDLFFRPKGMPEIYKKKICYFQHSLVVSCPLQILYKAEKKGIEPSLSRLIMHELSIGDICIDVGASYGFITMMMAATVGNKGHVFSFEANEYIYSILEKNIDANNLKNICTISNSFISNQSSVTDKKLDDLIQISETKKISLIKIDTDGSDYNCLLGASKLINFYMPIIIIEINEFGENIYDKLIEFGYSNFYDQHYNIVSNKILPCNLIASKKKLIK